MAPSDNGPSDSDATDNDATDGDATDSDATNSGPPSPPHETNSEDETKEFKDPQLLKAIEYLDSKLKPRSPA